MYLSNSFYQEFTAAVKTGNEPVVRQWIRSLGWSTLIRQGKAFLEKELEVAIWHNQPNMASLFLRPELDVNFVCCHENSSFLHLIVRSGNMEFIRLPQFSKLQCLLLSKDEYGNTPFRNACFNGDLPMIEVLLEISQKSNQLSQMILSRNESDRTVINEMLSYEDPEVLRLIYQYDSSILRSTDYRGFLSLYDSICRNREFIIRAMVELDPSILTAIDTKGCNLLHYACFSHLRYDDSEPGINIIRWVLHRQPSLLYVRRNDGDLPIHSLIMNSANKKILVCLLQFDPNLAFIENADGISPHSLANLYMNPGAGRLLSTLEDLSDQQLSGKMTIDYILLIRHQVYFEQSLMFRLLLVLE